MGSCITSLRTWLIGSKLFTLKNYFASWNIPSDNVSVQETIQSVKLEGNSKKLNLVFIDGSCFFSGSVSSHTLHKLREAQAKVIIIENPHKNSDLGADAVLKKPIKQSKVLEILQKFLPLNSPNSKLLQQSVHLKEPSMEGFWQKSPLIIVAEDSPVNQRVALHQLKRLGVRAVIANNGLEVLQLLAQPDSSKYALILMDCQMPEMDGMVCTQEIRKKEKESGKSRIPIIAVTANVMEDSKDKCLEVGMDDYISKPVLLPQLSAALTKWLQLDVKS